MLSDHGLSCPVQTVRWIKMKLGTEVGLVPGRIVLDGDPAPPKRGTSPNFRPMSVVDKRQNGSRCHLPRTRRHCVRWEPRSTPKMGWVTAPPILAHVCCGQTAGWIKIRWRPSSPPKGTDPNFRPMSIVAKQLDGSRRHFVRRQVSSQATLSIHALVVKIYSPTKLCDGARMAIF